jgi:hypothetical protein
MRTQADCIGKREGIPVWERHWKLCGDPFLRNERPFVSTSTHEEALARLIDTIQTEEPHAVVHGASGHGKTAVLREAIAKTRGPGRRIAWASCPVDGPSMLGGLARGLGHGTAALSCRAEAWRLLGEAIRLCHWQELHAVLLIDDAHELSGADDRFDLERLGRLGATTTARVTVIEARRSENQDSGRDGDAWGLSITLEPLTVSETERYLNDSLAAAGRQEPAFTRRAVVTIHSLSAGVPRAIGRLSSLALRAGALHGLEIVSNDVVEAAALECTNFQSSTLRGLSTNLRR